MLVVVVVISRDFSKGIPLASSTLNVLEKEARILALKRFFRIGKCIANHAKNFFPLLVRRNMTRAMTNTRIIPNIGIQCPRM